MKKGWDISIFNQITPNDYTYMLRKVCIIDWGFIHFKRDGLWRSPAAP